jgi:hypothetical protein
MDLERFIIEVLFSNSIKIYFFYFSDLTVAISKENRIAVAITEVFHGWLKLCLRKV